MPYGGRTAIVRGGGDLATGVIYRLWRAHYDVLCLEAAFPRVVRRPVSVAQAVFDGSCRVDGMDAVLVKNFSELDFSKGINVLIDPAGESIPLLEPDILVDAIMAKRNTGTYKSMAPLVLALGPGFTAPDDVHGVIETKRGHYLGRLITDGCAIPNTGIPGMEMGYTTERVLRAPADGFVRANYSIGGHIEAGDIAAYVGEIPIRAQISGVLRGLIHPSVQVTKGMKIGDIDPRDERAHCFSITDKALAVAGGVLEAALYFNSI